MHYVTKYLSGKLESGWDNTLWIMKEMDVTQWGILSVIFVISGFLALRTKL